MRIDRQTLETSKLATVGTVDGASPAPLRGFQLLGLVDEVSVGFAVEGLTAKIRWKPLLDSTA